jgi:PAS domain S-box-containing protein
MERKAVEASADVLDESVQKISTAGGVQAATRVAKHEKAGQLPAEAALVTFKKAVESSSEVIFLTDRDGVFTYVNPEFTRLYGHESEEVVSLATPRILKSGKMTIQHYERFWQTLLSKQVATGEFVNKRRDGSLVTVEGSANPIVDEQGEIAGFLAIQRDISRRVQAEEKIRRRNQELAALYAIATTVSQSLNLDQILNDALDEVLSLDMFDGMAKGMLFRLDKGKSELDLVAHRGAPREHPCLIKPLKIGECLCGLAAQSGQVIISEDCRHDLRHSRELSEMPIHKDICLPLKVRGELLGIMNVRLPLTYEVAAHDIALLTSVADQIGVAIDNARLFEAVSRQHESLRIMSSRLAEAEETERRRLAQELHDRVGSKLTALGINLNIIRTELPENESEKVQSFLLESQDLVEETARIIRGVMTDLRPPMLDELGLVETLGWYGEQLASRTGLTVTVQVDGIQNSLTTHIENTLFRIAQESLTNTAKHAQASHVSISLIYRSNAVRMIIADDGIGFTLDQPASAGRDQGWGLLIMAERAAAIGGRCWVESDPNKGGTRVITEILL